MDDYMFTGEDELIDGEVQEGKLYKEADFNRIIEIKAREANEQVYTWTMLIKRESNHLLCNPRPRCCSS
jgi:type I restriction enzyme R subunit